MDRLEEIMQLFKSDMNKPHIRLIVICCLVNYYISETIARKKLKLKGVSDEYIQSTFSKLIQYKIIKLTPGRGTYTVRKRPDVPLVMYEYGEAIVSRVCNYYNAIGKHCCIEEFEKKCEELSK